MNGYIIALVLLVAALIIWLYMLGHRLLWSECKHVIDQHLGRHLALGLVLFALLAIVLPPATYQMGFDHGVRYGASYFEQHYRHPGLATHHHSTKPPYAAPLPKAVTAGAAIDIAHYPAVGNQGQQGACAAWASAWVLSYLYRESHLTAHPAIKFSPEWLYSYYSDTYNSGQDGGSWPTQDLEMVPSIGVPQFKVLPAPGPIVDPFYSPSQYGAVYANATRFKMQVGTDTRYEGNPSDLVYQEAAAAISSGKPAILAVNVPPSFDAATQNNGRVWYQGAEASRGGHAIVGIAVDPTMTFPDGSVGGVLVQNQWTTLWGLQGRAWLSRSWLAANAWGVVTVTGGTGTPKGKA